MTWMTVGNIYPAGTLTYSSVASGLIRVDMTNIRMDGEVFKTTLDFRDNRGNSTTQIPNIEFTIFSEPDDRKFNEAQILNSVRFAIQRANTDLEWYNMFVTHIADEFDITPEDINPRELQGVVEPFGTIGEARLYIPYAKVR